jgi:hypothetical protein
MSGGYFNYRQNHIEDIAHMVNELIANNDEEYGYGYSGETITKFKTAIYILSQAAIMAQRIDWLVSGDDGEETFHQRWDEDLTNLLGEGLEEHA